MKTDTRERVSNALKHFFESAHQAAHDLAMIALDEYEKQTAERSQQAQNAKEGHPEKWLTVKEAAAMLQVSTRTIYDWAKKGKMPAHPINGEWRFLESELLEWKLPEKRDTQLSRPRHTKQSHLSMVKARR